MRDASWFIGSGLPSGVYGLLGVLIGGLLTGVVTFLLDRARAKQLYKTAIKQALVDLDEAARAFEIVDANHKRFVAWREEYGDPPREGAPARPTWPEAGWATRGLAKSWTGYRAALATEMTQREFRAVATGFGYVEQLDAGLIAAGHKFEPDDEKFLPEVGRAIEAARSVLLS